MAITVAGGLAGPFGIAYLIFLGASCSLPLMMRSAKNLHGLHPSAHQRLQPDVPTGILCLVYLHGMVPSIRAARLRSD